MKYHPPRNHLGLVSALVAVLMTGCFPAVSNLSKGATVPISASSLVPADTDLLVMPLWTDSRGDYIQDFYVIPASAIGTNQADVPRRIGVYVSDLGCGGSATYVRGYLLIPATGGAAWSGENNSSESHQVDVIKAELKEALVSGRMDPVLSELMLSPDRPVRVYASKSERARVLEFLDRITEVER